MGYRNNPLMEPEFFTPPGSKRLYKGGGGSGTPYYANQDKLFGTQADIATNLYNQYAAYSGQPLQGMANMVSDATSGDYTNRMRGLAGTDGRPTSARRWIACWMGGLAGCRKRLPLGGR